MESHRLKAESRKSLEIISGQVVSSLCCVSYSISLYVTRGEKPVYLYTDPLSVSGDRKVARGSKLNSSDPASDSGRSKI